MGVLAGLLMLLAALGKSVYMAPVVAVARAAGLSPGLAAVTVTGVAAVQAALAGLLISGVQPHITAPFGLVLTCVLMVIAARVPEGTDCGCYGVIAGLTPRTVLALNGVMLGALVGAWSLPPVLTVSGLWATILSVLAAAVALAAALTSLLRRSPLVALEPLRRGRRWSDRWIAPAALPEAVRRDGMVLFASPGCTLCAGWLKVLAARVKLGGFPNLVAVMPEDGGTPRNLPFPIVRIPQPRFLAVASSVPVAVRLEEGEITAVERGAMPEAWITPVRRARAEAKRDAAVPS